MSTQPCGCDPEARPSPWYCAEYPNCAEGLRQNRNTLSLISPAPAISAGHSDSPLSSDFSKPLPKTPLTAEEERKVALVVDLLDQGRKAMSRKQDEMEAKLFADFPRQRNRTSTLPTDPAERKKYPIGTGVLDYFPDALVAIARVSWQGNEQHNPGQPLHWARHKSTDQDDTIIRHYMERGRLDTDGMRHSAKLAWRVLALLQLEIEREQEEQA